MDCSKTQTFDGILNHDHLFLIIKETHTSTLSHINEAAFFTLSAVGQIRSFEKFVPKKYLKSNCKASLVVEKK